MQQIRISDSFRKTTAKAISSIVLFIFTYFVLICLAFALIALCGFLGIKLIYFKINTVTIMLAVGMISMGVLILIFLFKFIFKKHVTDLSHLTEISRQEQPGLFSLIEEIVQEVDTDFPKRIYVSADVNASVFYDSSFWSMILPVKKNLQIGIGLVNTVSVTEFKAILAHEFGHFSQRTMKVGSYVYNVNQVIYNMLYDNESFDELARKWAEASNYLTIFVGLAVKIVQGIQWVLKKVYEIINLSYMSLSREMEFHADEVAAHVAGSKGLITSLLRMELADHSYNEVLNYYNRKISESVKSENIYPQQQYVMNFLASKSKLPFENHLPLVTMDHLSRYNHSKLVITDQWASHPTTEDRVRQLEKLNIAPRNEDNRPASVLFNDMALLQDRVTAKVFANVEYADSPVTETREQFVAAYLEDYRINSFDEFYNSYYNSKNPSVLDLENISAENDGNIPALDKLFDEESVEEVHLSIALENDISTLQQIAAGNSQIKSFDYDGQKYAREDCSILIKELENKLGIIKESIYEHETGIYRRFLTLAKQQEKENELKALYNQFFAIDEDFKKRIEVYIKVLNVSNFMFETTPFEVIREKLGILKEVETELKNGIKSMLNEEAYTIGMTEEVKANFAEYLSGDYTYFYDQNYRSNELEVFYSCVRNYEQTLSKTYFSIKKHLLDYQVTLVNHRLDLATN